VRLVVKESVLIQDKVSSLPILDAGALFGEVSSFVTDNHRPSRSLVLLATKQKAIAVGSDAAMVCKTN